MIQPKLIKIAIWGGSIMYIIICTAIAIYAYHKGYDKALEDFQTQINLDKKTLQNHAKEVQTIHTESSDSANARLRKNLRTVHSN